MPLSRRHLLLGSLALTAGIASCSNTTPTTPSRTAASSTGTGTGTRTITDHGGNTVTVPATINRVAIAQIPVESTYIAYFDGSAPNLVGMIQARVDALRNTTAAEIAPEILDVDTSYYDNGELNVESLLNLDVDVVLYNAFNA
ncbi:hypothetical protein [Actinomyces sp.]|uniref:hypothetical protein n=1 Tax=Actinomyces sp. TaxID=29317 RepID=UPI0026DCA058|nr:hypothetical protein [Actinomyces sp.]MDO4900480.1 hypothetical protein [Actinomyces sp.]